MPADLITALAHSPWALPMMFGIVLLDALLVVIPGEVAVTAFGALAVTEGSPPLLAVVLVAAVAAFAGDAVCYLIGRSVGADRWTWMRTPRIQRAFAWARRSLDRSTASVVFTARFIPFARLAVNITAGATRIPARRYLSLVAIAALGWAVYQAIVGALVGAVLPDAPALAVVVSIAVAIALGVAIDAAVARRARRIPPGRGSRAPVGGSREDGSMTTPDAADQANGYDPDFLGIRVDLPRPGDGRTTRELRYPHFTVLLDPERRLAVVTGVVIDGETLVDVPRTGEWFLDERIPASEQAGPDVYSRNDLDRGHLVRRRDPGWGTPDEARRATEATFAYPNAAPQAAVFNQSKDLWLGLENHVLDYADANAARLAVFTAPVLAEGDPRYRGIAVPRRFWKIAAWRSAEGALAATGFVLDQSDLIDTSEGVLALSPLGAYRTFQVPLSDIAELAGVDLGPLVAADVGARADESGAAAWRPLRSVSEMSLR